MSTSCCPWWTDDTSDNISNCAFTFLPLMSISSIEGQFPLLFRLLCVPKQIGEPLWGPSLPVLSLACITQDAGRLWIYGERVLKPLGSELGAGRLAQEVINPPCCGQQMAAQSVYILLSSLVKKYCCRSPTKIPLAGPSGQWYAVDIVEGDFQKTSMKEGHTAGISSFCPSLPT